MNVVDKSPLAPHHEISSPPPPPVYHAAMIAYHSYTMERVRMVPEGSVDFLTYWYQESRLMSESGDMGSVAEDATSDILKGIETLRDRVVEVTMKLADSGDATDVRRVSSMGPVIPVRRVKIILQEIRFHSKFPESGQYWNSVLESLEGGGTGSIPLSELSDAVIAFLKSINSDGTISTGSEAPLSTSALIEEELHCLRSLVQSSVSNLRDELKRESHFLRTEFDDRICKVANVGESGQSTRLNSARDSPLVVPALPIANRRRVEGDPTDVVKVPDVSAARRSEGNVLQRREICGSTRVACPECLLQ